MVQRSIKQINQSGALLVFPIRNHKEPASLWSALHPRKKMKWEWSDEGDNAVADLWHLMKQLSKSDQVIYSKWYQGRATFFSRDLFRALLTHSLLGPFAQSPLSTEAKKILLSLEESSPQSTKELKRNTDLTGKWNDAAYARACKELYQRFFIVAYGEVDDGAFPSLAIGATRLIFEDLWNEAMESTLKQSIATIQKHFPVGSAFLHFFERTQKKNYSKTSIFPK